MVAVTDPDSNSLAVLDDQSSQLNNAMSIVSAVSDVLTLRTHEVLELPGSAPGIGRRSLRGVTEGALIVLDGAALLQDDRLVIDQGDGD